MTSLANELDAIPQKGKLHRSISWVGAFWVASGVPALVLFSIGGIAGTAGNLAFLIWAASIALGFVQSFTYAEIAGLFPNKSGGASIYGAAAGCVMSSSSRHSPYGVTGSPGAPVLSLGCTIAAAYVLNALAPAPSAQSSRGRAMDRGACRHSARQRRRQDGGRHRGADAGHP